ncbi:MAG TPA: amidohydrolase family protein [Candidatus Binataceae bacterium]|jgi:N-acyl-D-amino-acid deacylase|nr:amidohydrolase family protein [Candidatus Binataceae bacterium]
MSDLLIKNGTIVDGTGAARYRADVLVADGRIVEIGKVREGAAQTIDAADLIVAPGFIDPHTHYDAQICWDRSITPSSWHGVTTVVMGNCGVGLAPCRPQTREAATWDLVTVEAIPFDVLSRGLTWDWETFPQYMDAASHRGSAINLAFAAPLTPFRHYVMGEESMERAARADEIGRISELLREAIAAGAFGFTTTILPQHIGYRGRPLACRLASSEELAAYARVLRALGKGTIEISVTRKPGAVSQSEYELLEMLLNESGRPVTWLAMASWPDRPQEAAETLARLEPLISSGAIPQITCRPFEALIDLRSPMMLADMACMKPAFNRSVDEQIEVYRQPAFRDAFRRELTQPRLASNSFAGIEIWDAGTPALKRFAKTPLVQLAKTQGKDPVDCFFDLAIEDRLQTEFVLEIYYEDGVERLMTDPRTVIGVSDAGAHVDMVCDAGYCTFLLGNWVREKRALSLERAVARLTSEIADLWGIKERGRLAAGAAADLVIFDPNTIGSEARGEMRHDLPGGARRLVVEAQGIVYSIVNGRVILKEGKFTDDLAGQVLRSA